MKFKDIKLSQVPELKVAESEFKLIRGSGVTLSCRHMSVPLSQEGALIPFIILVLGE